MVALNCILDYKTAEMFITIFIEHGFGQLQQYFQNTDKAD